MPDPTRVEFHVRAIMKSGRQSQTKELAKMNVSIALGTLRHQDTSALNYSAEVSGHFGGSVMEVHHPVCILALGSGQRLLYRLGSGLGLVLVLV